MTNVLQQLKKVGCHIEETNNSLIITKADSIKPLNIETKVYPGFPTDLQAQWISIMILANGKSKVTDNVYYDRFSHVPELNRFGANIKLKKNTAYIKGVKRNNWSSCDVY